MGLLINCNQEIAKEAAEVPGSVAWFLITGADGKCRGMPEVLALEPWRASWRVLGGSVPLGWKRAYSGVRFTKAEAWLVRLSNLFQQRL